MTRILLTTTSFQDNPGKHHEMLDQQGFEIVRARGPLPEEEMLKLVGDFDGIICGDDAYTRPVLEKCLPRLRVLSKYGIGLDKIDLPAATDLKIPVTNCPGVNHTTVAEHAMALMLAMFRHVPEENNFVHQGNWKRLTGHEVMGKVLGIIGLGRIGKEVAKRARAFGMEVVAYDLVWDEDFAREYQISKRATPEEVLSVAEVLSMHMNLSDQTRGFLNTERLELLPQGAYVVNTSRGALIDQQAVADAVKSGRLAGYAADVVEPEPIAPDNPLIGVPGIVLTPHIGSRTYESVVRQACMAVENLVLVLKGEKPLAQANSF